jgi:hypothetical protein
MGTVSMEISCFMSDTSFPLLLMKEIKDGLLYDIGPHLQSSLVGDLLGFKVDDVEGSVHGLYGPDAPSG